MQELDWEAVKEEVKRPETKVTAREDSFGWTPGHFAANAGVAHVLKFLLDAKAKVDAVDHEANTMLMLGSRSGHEKVVEYLLGKTADMNLQNKNGWTALMWAAINGKCDVANLLLGASADLSKADNDGITACMWAARYGHLDVVEFFLACGLNLMACDGSGRTVLDHCNQHLQMASVIAAVHEVNGCLVAAAQRNDTPGVEEAIEAGADIDLRDGDGWTPLMWAAMHSSLDMVQLLVRYGARPSLLDERGHVVEALQTHHLASGEAIQTILLANDRLLEAAKDNDWQRAADELNLGAFINVRDFHQRTSLMWAAKHCNADAVHMLLSKNANVNDRDSFGWAAVHYAVIERSPEAVSMFHYLGADMKVKTYEGDSLLHLAVRADDAVMIQLLLAAGLDTEDVDVNLFTPLMMSAYTGLVDAMQCLIAYGAKVEVKATEAWRSQGALHLAVVAGHEASVTALLSAVRVPPKLPGEADEDGEKPQKTKAKAVDVKREEGKVEQPLASPSAPKANKETEQVKQVKEEKKGKEGKVPTSAKTAAGGVAAKKRTASAAPKAKVEFRGASPDALLGEAIRLRAQQPWKDVGAPTRVVVKQVDSLGNTPLLLAVQSKRTSIAMQLLAAMSDVNAADELGNTVLIHAALARQREVVEILLDKMGAQIAKKNKAGQTVMDLCEDPDILFFLQRRICLGKVPNTDQTAIVAGRERDEADYAKEKALLKGFCVRLEGLPCEFVKIDLENKVKVFLRNTGAPNLKKVKIAVDPITGRPLGLAYAEFEDAIAQDIAVHGDGKLLEGYPVRVIKEPRHRF